MPIFAKNTPYAEGLAVGQRVQAGDVIGFMGRTGYSAQENVNNIETVHLHFGLQLIFDESQKECDSEIWIDVYPIIELLASHCSSVARDPQTGGGSGCIPTAIWMRSRSDQLLLVDDELELQAELFGRLAARGSCAA